MAQLVEVMRAHIALEMLFRAQLYNKCRCLVHLFTVCIRKTPEQYFSITNATSSLLLQVEEREEARAKVEAERQLDQVLQTTIYQKMKHRSYMVPLYASTYRGSVDSVCSGDIVPARHYFWTLRDEVLTLTLARVI